METWTQRTDLQTQLGEAGEGRMCAERNVETYVITICKIGRQWEFAVWQGIQIGAADNLEGRDGEGGGRDAYVGGGVVDLWLVPVDVGRNHTIL